MYIIKKKLYKKNSTELILAEEKHKLELYLQSEYKIGYWILPGFLGLKSNLK